MAFTPGNDINILQGTDLSVVGAGAGDDTYILDGNLLSPNQHITISDTQGNNVLHLIGGLEIQEAKVANNAIELVLNNGAIVDVLGADTFTYVLGGDELTGNGGKTENYNDFVTNDLGLTVPATATATANNITVNNDGTTNVSAPSYSIAANSNIVQEGNAVQFTVTSTHAVDQDVTLTYQIVGATQGGITHAADGSDFVHMTGTVTIPAGQTEATFSITPVDDGVTEPLEGFKVELLDNNFNSVADSGVVAIEDPQGQGQTYNLTPNMDNITGTDYNDTVIGSVVYTYDADTGDYDNLGGTFNQLDTINGAGGDDTLVLNVVDPDDHGFDLDWATIQSIEHLVINATDGIENTGYDDINTSVISGLKSVAINKVGYDAKVKLYASQTTDVSVSHLTDDAFVYIDGGHNINVNADGGYDDDIYIGKGNQLGSINASPAPTGAVNVTEVGTGDIKVYGGTDVTVNETTNSTVSDITVGDATHSKPSGNVTITQNINGTNLGGSSGNIDVDGGKTVNITVNASNVAQNDDSTGTLTVGGIFVTGESNTTQVTINENLSTQQVTTAGTPGTTETATVTFSDLSAGNSVKVGGLTFTATQALTAEQVAQAFADLQDGAITGDMAVNYGYFTGQLSGWTSGDSDGNKVVFTSTTPDENVNPNLSVSGTGVSVQESDGSSGTPGQSSSVDAKYGSVTISDNGGVAPISNVVINGFDDATITSDALKTLSLKDGSGTLNISTKQSTLNLTVNNVGSILSSVTTNIGPATGGPTALDITTTGANSYLSISSSTVEALTVEGTQLLDLTGSSLNALQTVTVKDSAGIKLDASGSTVTDVNASATSGNNTVAIDASHATYEGGSGTDDVTLASTTVDHAISLGDGNDTLTLAPGTTTLGATIDGGAGTADTLSMAAADLNTATASNTFEQHVTGFERVDVGDVVVNSSSPSTLGYSIDLSNLNNIHYVIVNAIEAYEDTSTSPATDYSASLTIDNLANNGTVELKGDIANDGNATATLTINIANADSNTSDVLNLILDAGFNVDVRDVDAGAVVANDIENINITSEIASASGKHELLLKADSATTININGDGNLDLILYHGTDNYDQAVTTIDASQMTGDLTVTAANDSETIMGGSGNDTLTAVGSQDVLNGGAGNDTLVVGQATGTPGEGDLAQLTGGAGDDTFDFSNYIPSVLNKYATIEDLQKGDSIVLNSDINSFDSNKIELANTAVFQDYANAAVQAANADQAAWFQYDGNTYIVEDLTNDSHEGQNDEYFEDGADAIICITGLVDLSTEAAYSQDHDLLHIFA